MGKHPEKERNIKKDMGKYEGVSKRFQTESIKKYMLTTINTC
jgi:hypothetical protein